MRPYKECAEILIGFHYADLIVHNGPHRDSRITYVALFAPPIYAMWSRRIAQGVLIALVIVVVFCAARRVLHGDKFTLEDTVGMKSRIDGMTYRVQPGHKDPQAAADRLAAMNKKLIDLMRVVKRKYGPNATDQTLRISHPERARALDNLLARFNPDTLAENSPLDPSGDTSYVLDKGALVAFCLRERDPGLKKCLKNGCPNVDPKKIGNILDLDVLTFVAIHELTHISINAQDHPVVFWEAFKWLLLEADEAKILPLLRFDLEPAMYCGMRIDYNPALDGSLKTYG